MKTQNEDINKILEETSDEVIHNLSLYAEALLIEFERQGRNPIKDDVATHQNT